MQQDRQTLLWQRMLKGEKAAEFLAWLSEMEAEFRDDTWRELCSDKLDTNELHDINSMACVIGKLKDFLKEKIELGKDAEEEVNDGERAE